MHTTWDLLDLLIKEIRSLFTGAACLGQKYSLQYCIIGMLNICLTAALLGCNRTRMYRWPIQRIAIQTCMYTRR